MLLSAKALDSILSTKKRKTTGQTNSENLRDLEDEASQALIRVLIKAHTLR